MPGDEIRSLQHQTQFIDESIDLALVPIWVCAFRYHPTKAAVRIVVNGQTGKVGGVVPLSWAKLALLAGVAVLACAVVIATQELQSRPRVRRIAPMVRAMASRAAVCVPIIGNVISIFWTLEITLLDARDRHGRD